MVTFVETFLEIVLQQFGNFRVCVDDPLTELT
jgi:hypothetical protein